MVQVGASAASPHMASQGLEFGICLRRVLWQGEDRQAVPPEFTCESSKTIGRPRETALPSTRSLNCGIHYVTMCLLEQDPVQSWPRSMAEQMRLPVPSEFLRALSMTNSVPS